MFISNQDRFYDDRNLEGEKRKAKARPKVSEIRYRFTKDRLNNGQAFFIAYIAAHSYEEAEQELLKSLGSVHRRYLHIIGRDAEYCRLDAVSKPLRRELWKHWTKEFQEAPKLADRLKRKFK